MSYVIRVLGVAKSSVYYKPRVYPKRTSRERKPLTMHQKDIIKQLCGHRATYGVPRVRAVLERDYDIYLSKHKIHQYMKQEGLLIKTGRSRGSNRPHTGKVSVAQPNQRWASDITSIKCWNGEKLRLAIIIDCCDRSVIAWKAAKTIQGYDIELLMQEALHKRFGDVPTVNGQLQFLHDNGPEFIERGLQKQLKIWKVVDCATPTYSPQSNGICEAWNATFKRDYVYQRCLDNGKYVIDQIQDWIDDYNNFAPHSALNMKSPKQFYTFKHAA